VINSYFFKSTKHNTLKYQIIIELVFNGDIFLLLLLKGKDFPMIKKVIISILFLTSFAVISQNNWAAFTGKERAFFYQLTRKIENIKPEVFHLFEFMDSIPYINDTLPDYPYVVKAIEADSTKLVLHNGELARKSSGIVADIAMHYAVWELDLTLHFKGSKKPKHQYLKSHLKKFEHYVLEKIPQAATEKQADGTFALNPSLQSYFTPNLSIIEKIAAVKNAKFSDEQKFSIIKAIYYAQEKYVKTRTAELVTMLTSGKIQSNDFLLAAGDGDNWNELESILRTRYNRPLPDPKAFFRYDLKTERDAKTDQKKTVVVNIPILKLKTAKNQLTSLHVDVWGYHPERQTTIVIQKGGNSYVLYGKNEHRYVSPNADYETGVTYRSLIDELENVLIADLNEMIYGKRGFDYLIEKYEKMIDKTRHHIKDTEISLDKVRYSPAGQPKMKKKKKSKKASGLSYQDSNTPPQGKLTKTAKKRNILQSTLVEYQGQLDSQLSTLKQLKIEKEKAFDLLAQYNTQLDQMKKNMGYNIMSYEVDKLGNYTFNDGTTFNYATQDLTFNPENEEQYFEVILISFGKHVLDKKNEEVFVHFNLSHSNNKDKYTLYNERASMTQPQRYSTTDSIQIMEFFNALMFTKLKTNITLNGLGVVKGKSPYYFSDHSTSIIDESESLKSTIRFATLIQKKRSINITIDAFSNHVQPKTIDGYNSFKTKYPQFTSLDYLTYVKNKIYFESWKNKLYELATLWLKDQSNQKIVLKKIKSLKPKHVLIKGQKI